MPSAAAPAINGRMPTLNFLNMKKAAAKIDAAIQSISEREGRVNVEVMFFKSAADTIDTEAAMIKAATAGRKPRRMLCMKDISLYLKKYRASTRTMMQEGVMQPMVAMIPPITPLTLTPTKVAAFSAIGPGVI